MVYDVTSKVDIIRTASISNNLFIRYLEHIEDWLREVMQHASSSTLKALVGNKADLVQQKVVSEGEAKDFAAKLNIPFWETSAKNAKNVETMFVSMAQDLIAAKKRAPVETPATAVPETALGSDHPPKQESCCK